jgi:hypothetical protein
MSLSVTPTFGSHGIFGGVPGDWVGVDTPDGDRGPWVHAPVGSKYRKQVTTNQQELYVQVKADSRNDDWVLEQGIVCQYLQLSDFTDGGGATGTKVLNATIPAGAEFLRYDLINLTDFVGSATVEFDLGDGSDADRYNSTTAPRLDATAVMIDPGAASGTTIHTTAVTTLTATITDDSDFGDLTSGSVTVVFFYRGGTVS